MFITLPIGTNVLMGNDVPSFMGTVNENRSKIAIGAESKEEADTIKTMTVNNIMFSFLGYTYGTNGLKVPDGKEYLVNYLNEEKMIEDIQKANDIQVQQLETQIRL